jgi:hypothetical protein
LAPIAWAIVAKIIPTNRRALARDIGSRYDNKAASICMKNGYRRAGRPKYRTELLKP